ncbi:MAG: sulfur carrier protein ThiS [Solirubrobacterales bacterium]|nr:sulfur carrier protein ThiS [Solirubrobacterales bacterium]MBV9716557.1 sulfur carrier protein ThiS [Solirubrobacterales bacterium]
MIVTVNGKPQELAAGATVRSLVDELPGAPEGRGVAVALNGEVVPRAAWPRTELADGGRVEVVVAVQGG